MPMSIGGRWLRELAERAAMGAHLAANGGGPPAIERVQNEIKAEAATRGMQYGDLIRAVARQWEKSGVIPRGATETFARTMVKGDVHAQD